MPFLTFSDNSIKEDSLLLFISKTNIDTVKIRSLLLLANEIRRTQSDRALIYASQALEISERISFKEGVAKSNQTIADVYRSGQNYFRAREYYFKAFDLFKELDDPKGMTSTSNYIGMMYANQGAYPEALKFYYVSLRLNEKMQDKTAIAISYNNIGNINDLLGNYEEALSFYFKSLKLKEETKNYLGVANTNNNIGEIYKKLRKYSSAMDYYFKSLEQKRNLKNEPGIANTLNNIADVYLLTKDHEKALRYYSESLAMLEKIGNKEGLATVNNNLGVLYFKMKQYNTAIEYLKKSLLLSKEIGVTEEERKSYLSLSEIYEIQGNYKLANTFIKLNAAIKDSLMNDKNTKLISELQAKYEYEKNKKEIAILTKTKDIQQLEIYNSNILILSFSFGLALLLALVIVFLKANKDKQTTNKILVEKNISITKQKEEKELLLKEIHHRVKNNLQIINSLLRLQSHHVEDQKVISLFEECQNRVMSMALIHEKLYKSSDLTNINAKNYIETLAESLMKSYKTDKEIELEVECSTSIISIDTLMPLGLILNEFISNSLKYAFVNKGQGKIRIQLEKLGTASYKMIVCDDGIGLPSNFSWENSTTLGIELIVTLVEQINGTIEKIDLPGTCFKIVFQDIPKT